MRILAFWHIYAISHWHAIVSSQMRILLTSGLYDATEEIRVGFIGFHEDRAIFQKHFVNVYPKLKIKYYSNNPPDYEFPTLKLIEQDASDYIGYYFHTKGVTRPFEPAINYWQEWLSEAILNRWVEHAERVSNGYDASSVNKMKSPDHFSGNFWWFNRRYIDRLPKIDTLDKVNRFHAEQWICMCKDRKAYAEEFVEPGRDVFVMQYRKTL